MNPTIAKTLAPIGRLAPAPRFTDGAMRQQVGPVRRATRRGGFQWTGNSEVQHPGFHRGFTAAGKILADVKEFAALVRWCERTRTLERLSEIVPAFQSRLQTT